MMVIAHPVALSVVLAAALYERLGQASIDSVFVPRCISSVDLGMKTLQCMFG